MMIYFLYVEIKFVCFFLVTLEIKKTSCWFTVMFWLLTLKIKKSLVCCFHSSWLDNFLLCEHVTVSRHQLDWLLRGTNYSRQKYFKDSYIMIMKYKDKLKKKCCEYNYKELKVFNTVTFYLSQTAQMEQPQTHCGNLLWSSKTNLWNSKKSAIFNVHPLTVYL